VLSADLALGREKKNAWYFY